MKALIIDMVSPRIALALEAYGVQVDTKILPGRQGLLGLLGDYELLVMRVDPAIDREILDAGKKLRAIAVCSVGTNHIDLKYAEEKGIGVYNAPGVNYNAVAELALSKMLDLARRVVPADHEARVEGIWNKYNWTGSELRGKTCGIVGFGKIGGRVGELARAFGMRVIAHDRYLTDAEIAARGAEPAPLEALLERCDFLTLHTPLSDDTRDLISHNQIARMKPGAYIINTARGGILNEQAAYEALKAGRLGGVGIDVLAAELSSGDLSADASLHSVLYELDNVLVSPHIGGATTDAYDAIGDLIVRRIAEAFGLEK